MDRRQSGQSLVELGLLAPILIMLLVIVLDLGRLLITWVALTNAAREGAYAAAGQVAGTLPDQTIRGVVVGEVGGTVAVSPDATHVAITYPSSDVIRVTARSPFQPLSPLVGVLWGGNAPWISASAAFPLPRPTTTPIPITPSTPLPSATPTAPATPTPTRTPTLSSATPTRTNAATATTATPTLTPTATPTPWPCTISGPVPPLATNYGHYVRFTTTGNGTISTTWTLPAKNLIHLLLYPGDPFQGDPNPNPQNPPVGYLGFQSGNTTSLTVTVNNLPAGVYTAYFFNQGNLLGVTSVASLTYVRHTCP